MNPLSDIGMSDDIWAKFKARFVIEESRDENGDLIICGMCSSGEPISLHHIFIGFDRNGRLIHDYGTQGMFSCFACNMRRAWNVMRRAQGLPPFHLTAVSAPMIEPSDAERSEWSDTARTYVEALEHAYDVQSAGIRGPR